MVKQENEPTSLEVMSMLCARIAELTVSMSEQSEKLEECKPLYQDILENLREEIGDQKKAQELARDAAYLEGISDAIAAFIPDDVRQRDLLGYMLYTHMSKKDGPNLRARLRKRLRIVLLPSDDAVPTGFDGHRGMIWRGDVRAATDFDQYTFYSLVDGGEPEPDIKYTIVETGWLRIKGDNDFQVLRKVLIDPNPIPNKRRKTY